MFRLFVVFVAKLDPGLSILFDSNLIRADFFAIVHFVVRLYRGSACQPAMLSDKSDDKTTLVCDFIGHVSPTRTSLMHCTHFSNIDHHFREE
jgi:hypothetical protein